jgi:hypothetical protein
VGRQMIWIERAGRGCEARDRQGRILGHDLSLLLASVLNVPFPKQF